MPYLLRELLQRHAEMHIALPPQHHLAHVLTVGQRDRGVLLDDLADRRGELDLVLLLLGGDGETEHGLGNRRHFDRRRLALLRSQRFAGLDAFEPAEGDGVARVRLAALGRLLAEQGENARDALVVGAAIDRGAVGEGAGQHAGKRQLAAMGGVKRLEDVGARRRVSDPEALSCGSDKRGFMPQRLEQAQNAVAVLGRAEQNGADQPVAKLGGKIVEHLVARRRHVLEQLLHQLVVIVGELLQHREPRLLLALGQAPREWRSPRSARARDRRRRVRARDR